MKRTNNVLVAVALSLGAVVAMPAAAQMGPQGLRPGGPTMEMRMFHGIDTNSDGSVTREEYDAYQTNRFNRFDANKDGKITRDEFTAYDGGQPGRDAGRDRQFKAYDKNGDGTITREEWNGWAAERFAARDKNKDSKLTQDEMGPMGSGMMRGRMGMGSSGTGPMGGGMGRMGGQGG